MLSAEATSEGGAVGGWEVFAFFVDGGMLKKGPSGKPKKGNRRVWDRKTKKETK